VKAAPAKAQYFRILRDEIPRVAGANDEEGEEFLRTLLKSYPESQALRSLHAALEILGNNVRSGDLEEALADEWWTEDYLLWFGSWSKDAILEIEYLKHPERKGGAAVTSDLRGKLAKFGFDAFTRDLGGRGRTFLPGLACLAWYAETFNLEGKETLRKEFEEKTKMSFDQYIASLEPVKPH
jgi:hypothetical protein